MKKKNIFDQEDLFYVNLIETLSEKDSVRLNNQYIPKDENNGLIRFFNKKNALWFSRLKYSHEIIYYFGLLNGSKSNLVNPQIILKFNKNLKKSNIRIFKNVLYLIVELDGELREYKNSKFKFLKAGKKENTRIYYLKLDEINSKNIITLIEKLLNEFSFKLNKNRRYPNIKSKNKNLPTTLNKLEPYTDKSIKNKKTGITDEIKSLSLQKNQKNKINTENKSKEIQQPKNEINYYEKLDSIVFNINAFNLLNKIINLKNLDKPSKQKLIKFIFNRNENNDYLFTLNILNFFKNKTIDEYYIFYILNRVFENNNLNYDEYCSKICSLFNFELSKNHDHIAEIKKENLKKDVSFNHNIKLEKKLFKYDEKDLIKILINNKTSIEDLCDLTDKQIKNINLSYNQIANLILNNLKTEEIISELDNLEQHKIEDIILENFPFDNPRELQLETISKIYNAINNGYKYIILEAVSGFGKSLIAATLSNIYSKEKSYILTTTNQLIDQYINDFKKIEKMNIGRSNFRCKTLKKFSCSENHCIYSKCKYYMSSTCDYLYNIKEIQKSDTLVSTYYYFLKEAFYHEKNINPRKLLICDEGHNIDDKISDSIALEIKENHFKNELKIPMNEEYEDIIITEDYNFYLSKFKSIYKSKIKQMNKNNQNIDKFKKRLKDIEKFMNYFDGNNDNLVFQKEDDKIKNKKYPKLSFKPVTIKKMINESLLKYGDVCIFMSSSFFDLENFAYDLNIDETKIYSLKVPNIFDLSNNPIRIYDDFNMNNENIENGIIEDTIPTIKEILKKHENEKGVIHTTTIKKQTKILKENINDSRIIDKYFKNREEELEYFKNSTEPLVLISPSMHEGTDLPGDLCRFQIIFKLPYLPSNDPRIEKRKNTYEDGKEWYQNKMLTRLIQCYGRGIRSEEDYCKTYILDNRLWEILYEDLDTKNIIPKYFINAIEDFDENI